MKVQQHACTFFIQTSCSIKCRIFS
jgi:hypothetical protein